MTQPDGFAGNSIRVQVREDSIKLQISAVAARSGIVQPIVKDMITTVLHQYWHFNLALSMKRMP